MSTLYNNAATSASVNPFLYFCDMDFMAQRIVFGSFGTAGLGTATYYVPYGGGTPTLVAGMDFQRNRWEFSTANPT